ncbi:MAG TPA: NUDIX hydrolase [Ktedonobacteraceae bacterium]|nr:NUDIX hydrolase [Ktedonobacteraceae bacterium]
MKQSPEIVSRKQVYQGTMFSVYEYEIQLDGKTLQREIVERKPGVAIVPIDREHNVLLVKEYYVGSNSFLYALPGGSIEGNADPESEAMRELREETGYSAEKLIKLHYTYSRPAISTRKSYTFLAYNLAWDPLPDLDDFIEVVKLPLDEAIQLTYQDFESDTSTLGSLLMARDKLRELAL